MPIEFRSVLWFLYTIWSATNVAITFPISERPAKCVFLFFFNAFHRVDCHNLRINDWDKKKKKESILNTFCEENRYIYMFELGLNQFERSQIHSSMILYRTWFVIIMLIKHTKSMYVHISSTHTHALHVMLLIERETQSIGKIKHVRLTEKYGCVY